MNKLEKIFAVGGFIVGISLLGLGLYKDKKLSEDYKINWAIKGAGLAMRDLVEGNDKKYFEEKNNNYPR